MRSAKARFVHRTRSIPQRGENSSLLRCLSRHIYQCFVYRLGGEQRHQQPAARRDLHPAPLGQRPHRPLRAPHRLADSSERGQRIVAGRQPAQHVGLFRPVAQRGQGAGHFPSVGQQPHAAADLGAERRPHHRLAAAHQAALAQRLDHRPRCQPGRSALQAAQRDRAFLQTGEQVSLFGREIGGERWSQARFQQRLGSSQKTGRQHQPRTVEQRSQVVRAHPASQRQLPVREHRLVQNQPFQRARLGHRRRLAQAHDDALQPPLAEAHPGQVARPQHAAQMRRHVVVIGHAQRRNGIGWCPCRGAQPREGVIHHDFGEHLTSLADCYTGRLVDW